MFRNLSFLGISMRQRSHRRAFVAITYALTLALFTLAIVKHWLTLGVVFVVIWSVIPLLIFGHVVTPYLGMVPLFGPRAPQRVDRGIGLAYSVPPEEPAPDERDISARNSAYFISYWAITIYFLAAVLLIQAMGHLRPIVLKNALFICSVMMVILLLSLPQAVVLWTQPDVPAEVESPLQTADARHS